MKTITECHQENGVRPVGYFRGARDFFPRDAERRTETIQSLGTGLTHGTCALTWEDERMLGKVPPPPVEDKSRARAIRHEIDKLSNLDVRWCHRAKEPFTAAVINNRKAIDYTFPLHDEAQRILKQIVALKRWLRYLLEVAKGLPSDEGEEIRWRRLKPKPTEASLRHDLEQLKGEVERWWAMPEL